VSDEVGTDHGVEQDDNEAWKNNIIEWPNAMWDDKGNSTTI
jgi:hypothetical protein